MTALSGCFPPFPPNVWSCLPNCIVFAKAEPSSPLGGSEEEDARARQSRRAPSSLPSKGEVLFPLLISRCQ